MGGLGNQLFQYAAGVLQMFTTHGKLYLKAALENHHDNQDYRSLFSYGVPCDNEAPYAVTNYQSDGFSSWNPENYKFPNVLLYGYFQNYSVLKSVLPDIRNQLLEHIQTRRISLFNKYNIQSTSCFIHVRRTDYIHCGFLLKSVDYYKRAIQRIKESKHIHNWYILSDDLQWCSESKLFDILQPIYISENDPIDCLAFMSCIPNAIIANSTFSWWGAYLGSYLNANSVIYPKEWLNGTTPDLFPEMWIGL